MTDDQDLLLCARELRFAFPGEPAPVVDLPTLDVRRGQHTAIIGPSGCGKTTLLRLLTGILTPQAGSVRFNGHRLERLGEPARRAVRLRHVGMVFQRFALLPYCSAWENILVPLRLGAGRLDRAARARARSLADAAGIGRVLHRLPERLSQGEQQRVAICRALVTEPELIACDEPTGNLDPQRAGSIVDLILAQAACCRATVLLVTHDHALLDRFERVIDLGQAVPAAASASGSRP